MTFGTSYSWGRGPAQYGSAPAAPAPAATPVHTHTTNHVVTATGGAAPAAPAAAPQQVATAGLPTPATLGSGSLGQDPAYLAFLRSSGIQTADLNATAQNQLDAINNELQRRLPDLDFQGQQAQKQIAGNMEARGILRSGERFTAAADQAHQQAIQQAQLIGTAGDQESAVRQQLGMQLAAIQRGIAEQGLNSAGTVFGG